MNGTSIRAGVVLVRFSGKLQSSIRIMAKPRNSGMSSRGLPSLSKQFPTPHALVCSWDLESWLSRPGH
jgi:hypothetical protein